MNMSHTYKHHTTDSEVFSNLNCSEVNYLTLVHSCEPWLSFSYTSHFPSVEGTGWLPELSQTFKGNNSKLSKPSGILISSHWTERSSYFASPQSLLMLSESFGSCQVFGNIAHLILPETKDVQACSFNTSSFVCIPGHGHWSHLWGKFPEGFADVPPLRGWVHSPSPNE